MRKLILFLCLFLPLLGLANVDPPELETSEQITLQAEASATNAIELDIPTTLKINESEVVVLDYTSHFSYIDTEEKPEINRFFENPYVNKNTDYLSYDRQRQKNSERVNKYDLKLYPDFSKDKSNKLLVILRPIEKNRT